MRLIIFLIISCLYPFFSLAVPHSSLKSISVELGFETFINSPNHLAMCQNSLWTFSESTQKLISVDPKNGKIKKTFSVPFSGTSPHPIDIAAITCRHGLLYLLTNTKTEGLILEVQLTEENVILNRTLKTPAFSKEPSAKPANQRANSLFCSEKECWVLQEHPYSTTDFKKWTKIEIPLPQNLKKINSHPELNPFDDWQAGLVLAEGKYILGAINSENQPILMDPFHAQAVVKSGPDWNKWGSFGAWEGSFLSPKVISFINDDVIAIADAKLKAIFLFRVDGFYLGLLSWGPELIFSPDYPLGVVADKQRIFVADFRANKIIALDVKEFSSNVKDDGSLAVRHNLFRREEVMKDSPTSLCLNCHDGTISNHLYKFTQLGFHHPLQCSQCHDPHHEIKTKFYLRKPEDQLCHSCHKDYTLQKTNHVWNDHHKKGGSCLDCHHSHADSDKLLVKETPQLCLTCHQDRAHSHKLVTDLSVLEKFKNVKIKEGQINCQTCHETHINWKESHFVKAPDKVLPLCSSCHGDKAPELFKNFHKRMSLKKGHQ